MSTGAIVAVIIVVIVVAAVLVVVAAANRRRRLRARFGPEYDRAVTEHGSRREAEADLAERERHVRELDIRPLSPAARSQYMSEWTAVQEQFVDAPQAAVTGAQTLVSAVMEDRGYPTQPYDQTLADLSVQHASTLDHFRAAHDISENAAAGTASTEDLRQAMIHYRALFDELLGEPDARPDGRAGAEGVATTQPDGLPAADQARADQVPADEAPVSEPVVSESAVNKPVVNEPAVNGSADEPAVNGSAVNGSAADEPAVNGSAVDEPAVNQAAAPAAPVGPGTAGGNSGPPAGDPAREPTPDAVSAARRQER
jgi:hypothetical protein